MNNLKTIDFLAENKELCKKDLISLIATFDEDDRKYAAQKAVEVSKNIFDNKIFLRGLIEITNFCNKNCFYCGIRRENQRAERYRLSVEDIIKCCELGYKQGLRTFVLQGGEDAFFSDELVVQIIRKIKTRFSDCAVTLSLGEKSKESYKKLFNAGADRYLLRHESISSSHYKKLHPKEFSIQSRTRCLYDLKEIGYQTGCGFMVGSPYQTNENIVADLLFIKKFSPAMIGIGPFIPHKDTPFHSQKAGSAKLTLFLLSLIRLMLPDVLLPTTTALSTLDDYGIELGVLSGSNVVMPNLTPYKARKNYLLYDNKKGTTNENDENAILIIEKLKRIGYTVPVDRGDYIKR